MFNVADGVFADFYRVMALLMAEDGRGKPCSLAREATA